MDSSLIIAAAGRAARMGSAKNKQFLPLSGRPVLCHTLAAALAAGCFKQLIIVVAPGEEELLCREVLMPYFPALRPEIVTGGQARQESVYNGLLAVDTSCPVTCIHDGSRPLAEPALFSRCVEAAAETGAAVAAVPVKDTVKRVGPDGLILATPPRSELWAVQTPQAFRTGWLLASHRQAQKDGIRATDDSALLEHYGYPVRTVEADYSNIKITTPDDLVLAEALLGRNSK
jgi:2-C-methyl-D-erythritol 4-phosphate cytidylyltransferase